MALDSAQKSEIISNFAKGEKDTGSAQVQIALLTTRIKMLTEHLKEHKHDHSSRLGLLKLVGQRKRFLKYLKRTNLKVYSTLIESLNLKDK